MRLLFTALALLTMFSPALAVLEIPNAQPKVHADEWKWVLDSTWQGLKKRNIDAYSSKSNGLVHRPKSETPGDAVSEGVGYGMLLALYANDQTYFDKIFDAAKTHRFLPCQDWRKRFDNGYCNNCGGSASDADEDIAVALIFAQKMVDKQKWQNTGKNYSNEVNNAIKCVRDQLSGNGALKPGNGWGWGTYNPGYFAPAWYRVFKTVDASNASTWDMAANRSYELLAMNPGFNKGLVPDWVDGNAQPLDNGPGYNAYLKGQSFFKDAIRMLWRVANDVIWFPSEHSESSTGRTYLKNALDFIKSKGGPDAANFYQMNGDLVPEADKWTEFNNESNSSTWRYRQEHTWLTVGQWITAVMAVGTDEDKIAWSKKMAEFYEYNVNTGYKPNFFGLIEDQTKGNYETSRYEDTTHNEMYFDQFLAWFGVSLMSGTWVNVAALLDNPVQNTEGIPGSPFHQPEPPEPPEPPDPIIAKNNVRFGIQITQTGNGLRLQSKSDVAWKIHNLQGKLLFSSNSKEATWNAGNFKGMAVVSAASRSGAERKLAVVK
jgi:endo-1,4-beta-D-glucanase Y